MDVVWATLSSLERWVILLSTFGSDVHHDDFVDAQRFRFLIGALTITSPIPYSHSKPSERQAQRRSNDGRHQLLQHSMHIHAASYVLTHPDRSSM